MRFNIIENEILYVFRLIKGKIFLRGFISTVLLFSLIGASNVYAEDHMYIPTYDAYKTFTVTFNKELNGVKNLENKIFIKELSTDKTIKSKIEVKGNKLLIYSPEYGYKFNNDYELIIGKISDGKYKLRNDFKYKFRIEDNPYSKKQLIKYVEENDVSKEITEFRHNYNKRREGLKKLETKYFDVYYPDTELGHEYIEEIKIYADTAYAFLAKLFDTQVPVEIHLIDEEEAMSSGMSEGDIRKEELVTFVYICDEYNKYRGSIIGNMIHEMYHNFFSVTSDRWSSYIDNSLDVEKMLLDEGIARIISSVYTDDAFKDKPRGYSNHSSYARFNEDIQILEYYYGKTKYFPTDYCDAIELVSSVGWWTISKEEISAQLYIMLNWMDLYKKHGYIKFQDMLLNLKEYNNDFKSLIDDIYGIEEFDQNIKPYSN